MRINPNLSKKSFKTLSNEKKRKHRFLKNVFELVAMDVNDNRIRICPECGEPANRQFMKYLVSPLNDDMSPSLKHYWVSRHEFLLDNILGYNIKRIMCATCFKILSGKYDYIDKKIMG